MDFDEYDEIDFRHLRKYKGPSSDDEVEDFFTSEEITKERKEKERQQNEYGGKYRDVLKEPNKDEEEDFFFIDEAIITHTYTEEELKDIYESCKETIVHDYGDRDIYHYSDEERERNDMFNEIRKDLNKLKKVYKNAAEYVRDMRTVMRAWKILMEKNYIHSEKEFFKMVGEGRIKSPALTTPVLKHPERYDMTTIMEYISHPELDIKDLEIKDEETEDLFYTNFYLNRSINFEEYKAEYKESLTEEEKEDKTNEEIEEEAAEYANKKIDKEWMKRFLSVQEMEYLAEYEEDPKTIYAKTIPNKYIKGYDRKRRFAHRVRLGKRDRRIADDLHVLLNKIETRYNTQNSFITNNIFTTSKNKENPCEKLEFRGSLANQDEVDLFLAKLNMLYLEMDSNSQSGYTNGEEMLDEVVKEWENAGLNTIAMLRRVNEYNSKYEEYETKIHKAASKKLEKQILARVLELNENKKFKKMVAKTENTINNYEKEKRDRL